MSDIVLLKLQNGEEIIGRVVLDTDDDLVLEKIRAMTIAPTQASQGQLTVGMMPWMIGLPDGKVRIPKTTIMGTPQERLPKSLEDGYLQNTTGLQL